MFYNGRCQLLLGLILELGDGRIGLPCSEVLLNNGHELIGIKITGYADGDIVRHVHG